MTGLHLREEDMAEDPVEQFSRWYEGARRSGQPEPEAMALATAGSSGWPDVRYVLLRDFGPDGFVFYTNRQSRKGLELGEVPRAALAFRWQVVDRQVRVSGPVTLLDDAGSDRYFAGRPRGSQLAAWASRQSRPLSGRAELERRLAEAGERFAGGAVPRPDWWGGYRVEPESVEFWQQGEHRLHDRFLYERGDDGLWLRRRLFP